jgi:transcriptional regulator with XRE-family HTH domain
LVPEVRSPTVRRRELGAFLRALRTEQGLTLEQVAEHLLCTPSKVSRMETGRRGITSRDVRDLCNLYGITDRLERDRLMTLAEEGRQQAWWAPYDLDYAGLVGLEAAATAISDFQSSVVPGLLQTADYARAGHEGAIPRFGPDEIDQNVEAKLKRQQRLVETNPPAFSAVLDEAVLHRVTGGWQVMRAQLEHLIDVADMPNVVIQVVPFSIGAHPGVESNFIILELPLLTDDAVAADVVFVEGLSGKSYLDRPKDLDRYRQVFRRLQQLALNPEESLEMIAAIRNKMLK